MEERGRDWSLSLNPCVIGTNPFLRVEPSWPKHIPLGSTSQYCCFRNSVSNIWFLGHPFISLSLFFFNFNGLFCFLGFTLLSRLASNSWVQPLPASLSPMQLEHVCHCAWPRRHIHNIAPSKVFCVPLTSLPPALFSTPLPQVTTHLFSVTID